MAIKLQLTRAAIERASPSDKPYRLWDTKVPGLFLRVQPSGAKTWNVQWSRSTSKSIGRHPVQTLEGARAKALAILSDAAAHGTPAVAKPRQKIATLRDFMDMRYKPWIEVERRSGKQTVANIKAQFGHLYLKPMSDITAWSIEKFKAERLKAGIKPATVNRDLDRIRAALSKAVEWGLLEKNPLIGVKKSKGGDVHRVRYLTPAEARALRKALASRDARIAAARRNANAWRLQRRIEPKSTINGYSDHLSPLVLLALNTGLRRGELFGLSWDDVSFPGKQMTVRADNAKSGRTRHIPLNKEALQILAEWRKRDTGTGYVFPGVGGARLSNINRSWAALVKDAELVNFKFHDCRHDFASRLAMAGVDLYTIKELLGHADFATTQRYAHLSPGHRAAAVEKLVPR